MPPGFEEKQRRNLFALFKILRKVLLRERNGTVKSHARFKGARKLETAKGVFGSSIWSIY